MVQALRFNIVWIQLCNLSSCFLFITPVIIAVDSKTHGVDENVAGGMEYIEFTPDIKAALRTAAIDKVVPNWVERVGGADTPAVQMYNQYVAPLLRVSIDANGNAVEN